MDDTDTADTKIPINTRQKTSLNSQTVSEGSLLQSLGSDVNICISDITFKHLQKKVRPKITKKLSRLTTKRRYMSYVEFQEATSNLYKCCLTGVKDLHELHLRRKLGLKILVDIINRADPDYIKVPCIIHIMWSVMSCIHHFQIRLRLISMPLIKWARSRTAEKTFKIYFNFVKIIRPSMHRVALNSIITLYREGKLWQMEFACTALIVKLLSLYRHPDEGIEDIIYTMELTSLTNIIESKFITQVLYSVLEKSKWQRIPVGLLKKLLNMIEASIDPRPTDLYNYYPLRKGLESCLRNTTNNLNVKDLIILIYLIIKKIYNRKDGNEEVVAAFGCAIVFAAKNYKLKCGRIPLIKGPLPLLFGLFETNNYQAHLLALKVWQYLIDRNDNFQLFITPKIFFRDCNYSLSLKPCINLDKRFFKRFRHRILHISKVIFQNAQTRWDLQNLFHFMALTLVEIPCGYTASCFVTVAMGMQEHAINVTGDNLIRSNHFHAIVMSIMTLICYIHKANVFYQYVNSVMERRAEWAPHLNPPLRVKYNYSQHHILWNKPDLFFEDWEARYGMWKCFRTKKGKKIVPIYREHKHSVLNYFLYEPE